MRIKLLTTLADAEKTASAGAIIDVTDTEGAELIAGGYAVRLDTPQTTEAPAAMERAEEPRPTRNRRK